MIRRWTPKRFVVFRRARVIACVITIALICTGFFVFSSQKAVALTVNGKSKIVTTYAMSTQRLLEEQNIHVKTHDQVITSSGGILTDHSTVTVRSAYQTTVTVDGVTIQFWTVATSIEQLIGFFRANEKNAEKITVNLQNIYDKLSGGLSVNKEGPVTVVCDGKTRVAPNGKLPVSSILDSLGIVLGGEDRVTVENENNKTILRILRVTHGQEKRTVTIPFDTQTITDTNLPIGTRIVQTAGVNGQREDVYNVTYVDGKAESATLASQKVIKPVIDSVVLVGGKAQTNHANTNKTTTKNPKQNNQSKPKKNNKNNSESLKEKTSENKPKTNTNTQNPSNNSNNNSSNTSSENSAKGQSDGQSKGQSNGQSKDNGQSNGQKNDSQNTQTQKPADNTANGPASNAPAPAPAPENSNSMIHATPEQAKLYAKAACAQLGWTGKDWEALVWLWNRESHWRWDAENKSSGAYGIPQAYPADKLGDVSRGGGPNWRNDASVQINWGLNYILNRYGSPSAAVEHSRKIGWY